MTMRTYEYFACPKGHQGEEKTSENDQPYSKSWEQISTKGMKDGPNGTYLCAVCGLGMSRVPKPLAQASEPMTNALYYLPVTLGQLQNLQSILDVVSAREANPDAAVFQLLEVVRKARVEAAGLASSGREPG